MDSGSKASAGVKIATNSFTYKDLKRVSFVIKELYNIESRIQSAGKLKQYVLYFPKSSMPLLSQVIKKHLVPSMHYKLNGY
jgi:hypothetical protein